MTEGPERDEVPLSQLLQMQPRDFTQVVPIQSLPPADIELYTLILSPFQINSSLNSHHGCQSDIVRVDQIIGSLSHLLSLCRLLLNVDNLNLLVIRLCKF